MLIEKGYATEGTHWYASDATTNLADVLTGEAIAKVDNGKGKLVRITTKHADKFGLLPGITAPLKMLAKDMLAPWYARMAGEYAFDRGYQKCNPGGEAPPEENIKEVGRDAAAYVQDYVAKTADVGSKIHGTVEAALEGKDLPYDGKYADWLDSALPALGRIRGQQPGPLWQPEKVVVSSYGYAGRLDVVLATDAEVINVDIKTRDFKLSDVEMAIEKRSRLLKGIGKLTPRDTEPMQVAAGLAALRQDPSCSRGVERGFNLYLDRTDPTLCYLHEYTLDELARAESIFFTLLRLFYQVKGMVMPVLLSEETPCG